MRTARILKEVGDSICPFIKVSVDCPSNHQDGFGLPTDSRLEDKNDHYRFFKKEMSSRMTIMASSALPPNVKRATMTNEVLQRLRNTRRDLPWSVFTCSCSTLSHPSRLGQHPLILDLSGVLVILGVAPPDQGLSSLLSLRSSLSAGTQGDTSAGMCRAAAQAALSLLAGTRGMRQWGCAGLLHRRLSLS